MFIGHTTDNIPHKLLITGNDIEDLKMRGERNDPYFGLDERGSNTDLLSSPDVGVHFLSTVRDNSNIINIIYPNGLVHAVEYNVPKLRAFDAGKHFLNSSNTLDYKKEEPGLYVIFNHKLFNRTEIDRVRPEYHSDYQEYYCSSNRLFVSRNHEDEIAINKKVHEEVLTSRGSIKKNALIRMVYFIPYKDLLEKGSIYYPELGFTVSINRLQIGHQYYTRSTNYLDTLGYETSVEIIDNKNPYEEYFIRDIDGRIVSFISSSARDRQSGVYITTKCNGRVIRDEYMSNLDESYKLGVYKSKKEAELANYNEVDLQYKKMEVNLEELKNMKHQSDFKIKELNYKHREIEAKNESLALQLATAAEKYKMEHLSMNYDMVKKQFELKTIEMKFNHDMERMSAEKELFKIKSTIDMFSSINKSATEILKSRNDMVKSQRDVNISRNNNMKSAIEAGTKVLTTVASFV